MLFLNDDFHFVLNLSINKIPLVRLLIPFIGGIIIAAYTNNDSLLLFYCFLASLITLFTLIFIRSINANYTIRWLFGLLIYVNFLLAGYHLTSFKIKKSKTFNPIANQEQLFVGEINETPQTKRKTVKVILTVRQIKNDDEWQAIKNKVLLYLKKDSLSKLLHIGDIIAIKTTLKLVPPPKNPYEFNYRNYLNNHFIYHQAYINASKWTFLHKSERYSLFKVASSIRRKLINALQQKGLDEDELAIASALILGYKNNIDNRLKKAYSSAGAMHVLAVSGLHVGIIYLLFHFLLSFLEQRKYGRYIKSILLLLILWGYAFITGLSPSILRAATMFSFIIVGKTLNRNSNIFNTLAASALVLLMINPLYIMEVGFQLSYAAVIGIIIIQPLIYPLFISKWWLLDKVWEITTVSIAAQIATFPLALLYFHQFPNYFIFSNLIIIPLASLILYLGVMTIACLSIPLLSDYLILALKYLIRFLNWIVTSVESLPYSLSSDIRFHIIDTWLVYIIVVALIALIVFRKFKFLMVACVSSIIFLLGLIIRNYGDLQQHQLIIYSIPQHTAINFIDKKSSCLLTDELLYNKKEKLLYHIQNNWVNSGIQNRVVTPLRNTKRTHYLDHHLLNHKHFFQFYQLKGLLVDQDFQFFQQQKLKVDLVIIDDNTTYPIASIIETFQPKEIVVTPNIPKRIATKIANEASKLGVKCHDIIKDGAFIKTV